MTIMQEKSGLLGKKASTRAFFPREISVMGSSSSKIAFILRDKRELPRDWLMGFTGPCHCNSLSISHIFLGNLRPVI